MELNIYKWNNQLKLNVRFFANLYKLYVQKFQNHCSYLFDNKII
jgi:hypothetical protein